MDATAIPSSLRYFSPLRLAGTIMFLLGLGSYLSTMLKTIAGAVVSTLGLYFVPKFFFCAVPGPLLFLAARGSKVTLGGSAAGMLAIALVPPAICTVVGLFCMRAAIRGLRRDIF
jgi:hypothetical protein